MLVGNINSKYATLPRSWQSTRLSSHFILNSSTFINKDRLPFCFQIILSAEGVNKPKKSINYFLFTLLNVIVFVTLTSHDTHVITKVYFMNVHSKGITKIVFHAYRIRRNILQKKRNVRLTSHGLIEYTGGPFCCWFWEL